MSHLDPEYSSLLFKFVSPAQGLRRLRFAGMRSENGVTICPSASSVLGSP